MSCYSEKKISQGGAMGEEPEHEYTFMPWSVTSLLSEGHGNSINFAQCNWFTHWGKSLLPYINKASNGISSKGPAENYPFFRKCALSS